MITNYVVERLDVHEEISISSNWTKCSTTRIHYYTDESLKSARKYQYRVIAENLQGRSVPCEPTSVITTLGRIFSFLLSLWYFRVIKYS
jgi:hypothetical protein